MVMSSFPTSATTPFQVWHKEAIEATRSQTWPQDAERVLQNFLHTLDKDDKIAAFKLLRSLHLTETQKQVTILLRCAAHLKFLQPRTFHLFTEMWQQHKHDAGFEHEMLHCIRELTIL